MIGVSSKVRGLAGWWLMLGLMLVLSLSGTGWGLVAESGRSAVVVKMVPGLSEGLRSRMVALGLGGCNEVVASQVRVLGREWMVERGYGWGEIKVRLVQDGESNGGINNVSVGGDRAEVGEGEVGSGGVRGAVSGLVGEEAKDGGRRDQMGAGDAAGDAGCRVLVEMKYLEKWLWGRAYVRGSKTVPAVVSRLARLAQLSSYGAGDLARAERNLRGSGYFGQVRVRMARDGYENFVYPIYELVDAKRSRVEGVVNWQGADGGGGWSGLEGFFHGYLFNIKGTGRELRLDVDGGRESKGVKVYYVEPWVWGSAVSVIGEGQLLKQKGWQQDDWARVWLRLDLNGRSRLAVGSGIEYVREAAEPVEKYVTTHVNYEYAEVWGADGLDLAAAGAEVWGRMDLRHQSSVVYGMGRCGVRESVRLRRDLYVSGVSEMMMVWPWKGLARRSELLALGDQVGLSGVGAQAYLSRRAWLNRLSVGWVVDGYNVLSVLGEGAWVDHGAEQVYESWRPEAVWGYGGEWRHRQRDWAVSVSGVLRAGLSWEQTRVKVSLVNSF